jgi:hypothetical protein
MPKCLAVVVIAALLMLTGAVGGVVTVHHAGANSLRANIGGPVPPEPPPHNIGGPVPPEPPPTVAS